MRNGRIAVMAVGVLAAVAVAVPALAGETVKIHSKVTLHPDDPAAWHGRVESSRRACEVHRKVKVFRVQPGADSVFQDPDGWYAIVRSNRRGKWKVPFNLGHADRFYAKLLRGEDDTARTTFVCGGDISPKRHFSRKG